MIDDFDRAEALYKIRIGFGWSATDAAGKLDVGARMINLWETRAQEIPDGRWRLFVHEVTAEMERRDRSLVVIVAADGVTPIDVVSRANFLDIEINEFDDTGMITSCAINRFSKQPYIHQQRFNLAGNEQVRMMGQAWKVAMEAGLSSSQRGVLAMNRWLTRRLLEAEATNPNLRRLKEQIASASAEVDALANVASAAQRDEKLQALDKAVFALIHEVDGLR